MRGRWRIVLALLLAVIWGSDLHAAPVEGSDNDVIGANIAVLIDGEVSVKHKGRTTYEPVVFGTNLRDGDLVQVNSSSHAKVVCSDLTVHELPSGIAGVPCNPKRNVLQGKDGSIINITRSGPPDGSYPVVLSPRKTKLFSPNPTVQWTPVAGVELYGVQIRGPQFDWKQPVKGTQFVYPAQAPKFKPGVDYRVIVYAGERSSLDEPGKFLGFSILNANERSSVERDQKRIESLGLPDGTTGFLIASLYAANGLRAEAIQRLENVSTELKVAAVPRLTGDLYLEVGLIRQAESNYLQALDLCTRENDKEGLMVIHLVLANIYEDALGNNRLAKEHLDAALELAGSIGDERTIDQASKRLERLKKEGV